MVKGKIAKCETVENKKGTDKISIYLAEGAEQAMRWKKEGKEVEIIEKKDEGESEQRESDLNGVYRDLAMIMEIVAELIIKEKNKLQEKEELL